MDEECYIKEFFLTLIYNSVDSESKSSQLIAQGMKDQSYRTKKLA